MNKPTAAPKQSQSLDLVLQEIWRIKDTLSASYEHDVDRLFGDARKRQELSGRPSVNLKASVPRRRSSLWRSGSGRQ